MRNTLLRGRRSSSNVSSETRLVTSMPCSRSHLKIKTVSRTSAQSSWWPSTLKTSPSPRSSHRISLSTKMTEKRTEEPISIVKAALATSAAPTYYLPTAHAGRSYLDGGMGFNNPSEIAIRQLTKLYGPSAYAANIISLRTGVRSQFPYSHPQRSFFGFRSGISSMFSILSTFALISTDSESVHSRMTERFEQTGAYFRFNPPGLESIELDDWQSVDAPENLRRLPRAPRDPGTHHRSSPEAAVSEGNVELYVNTRHPLEPLSLFFLFSLSLFLFYFLFLRSLLLYSFPSFLSSGVPLPDHTPSAGICLVSMLKISLSFVSWTSGFPFFISIFIRSVCIHI